MCVGGVPGDHHVVPLVVVQRIVAVPLQQARPVPKVKHIMDETRRAQCDSQREILIQGSTILPITLAHPFTSSTAMKSFPSPLLKKRKPSGDVVLNWKKRCMEV